MQKAGSIDIKGIRRTPMIHQSGAAECGLACIAMVAGFHDDVTDLAALKRRFPLPAKGTSLTTLIKVADEVGLTPRAMRCESDELGQLVLPAIL